MNEEIKKIEISNRIFVLLLILILGSLANFLIQRIYDFWPPDHPREIIISAQGKAFAKPDIAQIKIGVSSEGWTIQEIFQENTEKMNIILNEIKKIGIEEKDIQTTRYNLAPRYEWKEGQRIFKGYVLDQEIKLKIRNFEKIGEIINKATENGANLVGEISFSIDDPETIRQKAREEAIKKAKEKAEKISQQTGIKLKKIVNVYEDYFYSPLRTETIKGYTTEGTPGIGVAPEIQPGEEEVIVKINLVYLIK